MLSPQKVVEAELVEFGVMLSRAIEDYQRAKGRKKMGTMIAAFCFLITSSGQRLLKERGKNRPLGPEERALIKVAVSDLFTDPNLTYEFFEEIG